jgi:peptide/nickel transport system ATP-binding protein
MAYRKFVQGTIEMDITSINSEAKQDDPLISVKDLCVDFDMCNQHVHAVRGVSFDLNKGEILGIVGESGSGKSVMCRSLLGLLPPKAQVSGDIFFDGQDLSNLSDEEWRSIRGKRASMIFQNPSSHLDPLMKSGTHVVEPLRFHDDVTSTQAKQTAIELLKIVGINDPEHRVDAYPHELSGGMKQRVMIASAIACQPNFLIADEPTTALDVTVQSRILKLLKELNQTQNLTIIFVSHDLGVISEICDRVLVMKDGVLVEQGTTKDIILKPQDPYTQLLISSQPSVRAKLRKELETDDVKTTNDADTIMTINDLSVEFDGKKAALFGIFGGKPTPPVKALSNVSFQIKKGEVFGVVGESGSGKSTLARVITHLQNPTTGSVSYDGRIIKNFKGDALINYHKEVQMAFQNPYDSLNPRYTIKQTIAEPLIVHNLVPRNQVEARTNELMELVELPSSLAQRRPGQLSGGQCQRVGIARALAMKPKILIADEITSALDVTIQAQILDLLERIREKEDLTIIYISHDLAVVRMICQRVGVFRAGRLIEIGSVGDVLTTPKEEYTRMLIASAPKFNFEQLSADLAL